MFTGMRRYLLLVLGLLLTACSDDGGQADATLPDIGRDAAADISTPDQVPKPDAPPAAQICGTLKLPTDLPLSSGDLLVCNDAQCNAGTSDSTGAFCVAVTSADDYLFHALEQQAGGKHLGDLMVPVTVSASEVSTSATIDLGVMVMSEVGPAVLLDPATGGTLDLGSGAKLVVPAGATVLPPLKSDASVALAVLDPLKLHPRLVGALPGGKTPEAAFVIVPAAVSFSSPITFELPGPGGLTTGTTLDVVRVNVDNGKLELKGEATVDAGGKLVNASGKGLSALGVLVLVQQ